MKLYEYACLYNPLPTKEQVERGEAPKSELIVIVTQVLANSDREAMMIAARSIPDQYMNQLDRVEVVLRPF